MTSADPILHIPRVGVEHEYRWILPEKASADSAARDSLRDDLVRASSLPAVDQAAILQHTLCFDTHDWDLAGANCSLTALVNTGNPPGPSWLVAKETIQWIEGRRDVLELTEYVADLKALSQEEVLASRPAQHLVRRVPALGSVDVFAYLSQRRTKAALRAGNAEIIAISCDGIEVRDKGSAMIGSLFVVEVEANQASRVGLDVLRSVADNISALLGQAPVRTTKPQIAAARLGWGGATW
jgi:hypothetical protein